MNSYEQIIQHSDGRLYLVEYLESQIITAIYAECGERLEASRHPEFKKSLSLIFNLKTA